MAIAKESGFGASGKIGDVVFRRRKSGTVIASQPIKRGTPTHPRQIKSNQKFRFCAKLSSSIKKIECFAQLWKDITLPDHSMNNSITELNYGRITPDFQLNNVRLAPVEPKFMILLNQLELIKNNLLIELNGSQIPNNSRLQYYSLSVAGLVYYSSPLDITETPEYLFTPFVSKEQPVFANENLIFDMFLDSMSEINNSKYETISVLFCMVLKNNLGAIDKISESVYHTI